MTHLHQIGNTASLLLGYNECSHLHSWSSPMLMSEWLPLSCIHIYYVPCSPIYILFLLLGFVIFSFAIPLFPTVRPRISDLFCLRVSLIPVSSQHVLVTVLCCVSCFIAIVPGLVSVVSSLSSLFSLFMSELLSSPVLVLKCLSRVCLV